MSLEDRGNVANEKTRRARKRLKLAVFRRLRRAGLLTRRASNPGL